VRALTSCNGTGTARQRTTWSAEASGMWMLQAVAAAADSGMLLGAPTTSASGALGQEGWAGGAAAAPTSGAGGAAGAGAPQSGGPGEPEAPLQRANSRLSEGPSEDGGASGLGLGSEAGYSDTGLSVNSGDGYTAPGERSAPYSPVQGLKPNVCHCCRCCAQGVYLKLAKGPRACIGGAGFAASKLQVCVAWLAL
jgi:hypothetical protein